MKNLVSIMMPAYNAEQFIGKAIESVLMQTYNQWELIIVNDGSTDRTNEIISQYVDPRIKIINQVNGGEASARNAALDSMKGEYLAFLDADDIYCNNHLESMISYLKTHPFRDAVYSDGFFINQYGEQQQPISTRRSGPFEGRIFEDVVRSSDVFGPPGCVVLRSQPVFANNIKFDTEIGYGTDWDFWIRFSNLSEFGYLDQFTYLYRIHNKSLTINTDSHLRKPGWAKLRLKTIKMTEFSQCSSDTRFVVFYDLLINLLSDNPEAQKSIIQLPEFRDIPMKEQSRLLRIMASKAIIKRKDHNYIKQWLNTSLSLNPKDRSSILVLKLFTINPTLCGIVLRIKAYYQSTAFHKS